MTIERKIQLSREWDRLTKEMEKAERTEQPALAHSYENSIARIEGQLATEDVDPKDWLE